MLTIRHCPKCHALQPDQPACGVCGARKAAGREEAPGGPDMLSLREAAELAVFLVTGLGGFVVAAAVVLVIVFLGLR